MMEEMVTLRAETETAWAEVERLERERRSGRLNEKEWAKLDRKARKSAGEIADRYNDLCVSIAERKSVNEGKPTAA